MIIRGVFSMSIIDNLKSLFKRGKDNEEKGINDLKSEDTKVTSSNNLDESVVGYFTEEANTVGIPYQTLINMYLRDCMMNNRHLAWEQE